MKLNKFKIFIILFITAFFLNAVWELLHYRLYFDLSGISKYPHLLLATFTDAIIITLIFILIILKNKNMKWIKKPNKTDYFIIVILAFLIAVFIEVRALLVGRWAYRTVMPTIFGLGISPLMQLPITGILTVFIFQYFIDKF